jgi:hypothetical protein
MAALLFNTDTEDTKNRYYKVDDFSGSRDAWVVLFFWCAPLAIYCRE